MKLLFLLIGLLIFIVACTVEPLLDIKNLTLTPAINSTNDTIGLNVYSPKNQACVFYIADYGLSYSVDLIRGFNNVFFSINLSDGLSSFSVDYSCN
ncbi:hypothetical protein JXM83_06155 [Candidatus Woesearchaeota archaeon]|nr:hypothetical protein [Candidatus Woesearchaeota archaeon]